MSTRNFTIPYTAVTGLIPGQRFVGATAQPSPVGTGPAADENVMARWNVVPHQDVAGTLNIGVVAIHSNGIDRVEISANGGPWVVITEASYNADSGTVEYWTPFIASRFADGPVEFRARIYPKAGVPRVLQGMTGDNYTETNLDGTYSLLLNANSGSSLTSTAVYVALAANGGSDSNDGSSGSPFATVAHAAVALGAAANGGIIYLKAGEHLQTSVGSTVTTTTRWLTVRPAPGLTKADVSYKSDTDAVGYNTKLIRFVDVTITGNIVGAMGRINSNLVCGEWYDNCAHPGTDRFTDQCTWATENSQQGNHKFATNCTLVDREDGFEGFALIRGCTVGRIGGCPWHNCGMVVDSASLEINADGHPGFHPDTHQIAGRVIKNMIVYNVTNTLTAWINLNPNSTEGSAEDIAFVNVTMSSSFAYSWIMGGVLKNVYSKNCTFTKPINPEGAPIVPTNVIFEGCVDGNGSQIVAPEGCVVR